MPTTGNAAARGNAKLLIAVLLLIGLMVGLTACRGFFGQAPIAILTYELPANGDQEAPVTITFDISGSTDPDGTVASYELDYGDGSPKKTGTAVPTAEFTHEYTEGGTYTVTLTVTDNDGRIGKDTKIIVIGAAMITFASKRNSSYYGIYRMQVDNIGSETEVRNTAHDELFPDLVRGTRDKIAYAAEGSDWDIFTMGVDGGALAQLTQTTQTPSNQIQPSWSYLGTKIAYASNEAQTPSITTWEIYTMTAAGGSQTALITQTPSWAPAYSPKNNNIVFVSEKNNSSTGSALWFWNGTTATQLWPSTTYNHAYRYGDASPTGFLTTPGALATGLDLPTDAGISKPAWSLDGTKIAFSSNKGGKSDIYVIDISTTGTASNELTLEAYVNSLITGSVTSGQITDTTKDEFCPYWLEDRSGLAFVRVDGSTYKICKVSFSDGSVTTLTSTGTGNVTPATRR